MSDEATSQVIEEIALRLIQISGQALPDPSNLKSPDFLRSIAVNTTGEMANELIRHPLLRRYWDRAIKSLAREPASPTGYALLSNFAFFTKTNNDWAAALRAGSISLDNSPDNFIENYFSREISSYIFSGKDYHSDISIVFDALIISCNDLVEMLYGRTQSFLHRGDFREAINVMHRINAVDPTNESMYTLLIDILFEAGRRDEAFKLYSEIDDSRYGFRKYYVEGRQITKPICLIIHDEHFSYENDAMNYAKTRRRLLDALAYSNVPLELRDDLLAKMQIEIARATRPKWADRHDRGGELATLTAPAYLRRVHAADISEDGTVYNETIRAIDPDLMKAVEVYISRRISRTPDDRAVDLGDASGLKFILSRPSPWNASPASQRTKTATLD